MPAADAGDDRDDAMSGADLTVESYPDATIMPVSPYPQPRRPYAFRFGVFDRRGRLVRPSLLHRSFGQVGFAADPESPTSTVGRDVIFAGHLSYHFGHFLLESLARLWFAVENPELPIVWACRPGPPQAELQRWQRQVLDVLHLSNEVILLTEPTRFQSVHVPRPGYRVQDAFSARHVAFLAAYPARPREPDLRLWLSRARLDSAFGSLHAPRLDAQLADYGWTVVHPERLAIAAQLELLATATRVAGEEGSAFHLLVLLADVSGLQVDVLCRDPGRPLDRQNGNYGTIARARGLRQRLHLVEGERVLAVEAGRVRKVATTLAGHLEAVGIPRGTHPAVPSPPRPVATLVRALAVGLSARSYVEVGGARQGAYPDVGIAARHVVKPWFPVDPRRAHADGLELFEMPPHEFFAYCADLRARYDVVLLDGLDPSSSLVETILASRRHTGAGTIWLVTEAAEGGMGGARGTARSAGRPASEQLATLLAGLVPGLRTLTLASDDGACVLGLPDSVSSDLLLSVGAAVTTPHSRLR